MMYSLTYKFILNRYPMSVDKKQRRQKEVNLANLPPRGTGRRTGKAIYPHGTGKPLTDEERKKRHKEQTS